MGLFTILGHLKEENKVHIMDISNEIDWEGSLPSVDTNVRFSSLYRVWREVSKQHLPKA